MKKQRRLRGGRIIGEGMQGIAFSPPLLCEGEQPDSIKNTRSVSPFSKTRKSYVSKITKQNVANTEVNAAKQLRLSTDPHGRFTAPALSSCKAAKKQTNRNYSTRKNNINARGLNTLVFSRYRGKTLEDIFDEVETLSLKEVEQILVALANLLVDVAINVNGKSGILHYDAHFRNIVYDPASKDAALIDFGFARNIDPAIQRAIINKQYDTVPPSLDILKIHDEAILQFFMFGKSPPTSTLLKLDALNKWYKDAKELRRSKDATLEDYLTSANILKHAILVSEIHEYSSESD